MGKMRKVIIFDFKRTVFDPGTGKLLPGTKSVLQILKNRGFNLYLISHGSFPRGLIDSLGIGQFFTDVVISKKKSIKDFEKIVSSNKVDIDASFVVGDRIKSEIAFGNSLGFKTIWVKRGKFADEVPNDSGELPNATVRNIEGVLEIAR